MNSVNKQISHISWMISACIEQYRFVHNDIKIINRTSITYNNNYNNFIKHFHLSLTLLKSAINSWNGFVKNNRLSNEKINNIYSIYIKRSILQLKLGLDSLCKINYELLLQNQPFLSLKNKISNLFSLLLKLEQNIFTLLNFSF